MLVTVPVERRVEHDVFVAVLVRGLDAAFTSEGQEADANEASSASADERPPGNAVSVGRFRLHANIEDQKETESGNRCVTDHESAPALRQHVANGGGFPACSNGSAARPITGESLFVSIGNRLICVAASHSRVEDGVLVWSLRNRQDAERRHAGDSNEARLAAHVVPVAGRFLEYEEGARWRGSHQRRSTSHKPASNQHGCDQPDQDAGDNEAFHDCESYQDTRKQVAA